MEAEDGAEDENEEAGGVTDQTRRRNRLPASRVDQRVSIAIATERSVTTRLKDAPAARSRPRQADLGSPPGPSPLRSHVFSPRLSFAGAAPLLSSPLRSAPLPHVLSSPLLCWLCAHSVCAPLSLVCTSSLLCVCSPSGPRQRISPEWQKKEQKVVRTCTHSASDHDRWIAAETGSAGSGRAAPLDAGWTTSH